MKKTVILKGKVFVSVLLVAVMTCLLFTGFKSSAKAASTNLSKSDKVIELTYWAQADRQKAFEPITAAFNQSQKDIHVTISYYDTDGIKSACKVAAAGGTLPDMWFNWGGQLGQYYVNNGCTYDLSAYASKNNWSNKFKASALSLCKLGGKLSGYPTNVSVLGFFYKKSTFAKYNITPPKTLAELEKDCAKLKANGVTPFSTSSLYGWHVMRIIEQLVEYYGGAGTHDKLQTMSANWNSSAVISALTKYQSWCKLGYFPKGFLSDDPNNTLLGISTGKCAMDLEGQWYDGALISNQQKVDDYGWFPFPNKTNRMSAFVEMTQLNAKLSNEKLDACVKYLDYVFSANNAQTYSTYMNLPLATVDAKIPNGQAHVKSMYDYANAHGTFTITDQALPSQVADALFKNQDALYSGSTTPSKAAAAIEAAIKSYKK